MPDFTSKPGSFLPFLEYSQRTKQARLSHNASPLTLLEILLGHVQQMLPIVDLQNRSGMDPSRYREALKSLRDAGYVAIEGPSLEEVVRLTGKGAEVAQLARPA